MHDRAPNRVRSDVVSNPEQVLAAFVALGAVSPDTARPLADLPGVDPGAMEGLLLAGTLQETRRGYYVPGVVPRQRFTLKTAILWLLILVLPLLLITLFGR